MKAIESLIYGLIALVIGFVLYEQVQFSLISIKDMLVIADAVLSSGERNHDKQEAGFKNRIRDGR